MAQYTITNGDSGLTVTSGLNNNFDELYTRDIPEVRLNNLDEDYVGQTAGEDIRKIDGSIVNNQCTAWVTFDGTQTPPVILNSYNVNDIIRISTGEFEIDFEIDMDNTNYSINTTTNNTVTSAPLSYVKNSTQTISNFRILTTGNTGSGINNNFVSILVFGGRS